ncbi:hypothetical protein GCM10020331_101630 [Ectobacillus funiculus]
MKKILTLLIVIIPVLTGCWSRHEVNDVAIVLGVALDKAKNGNLLLSLQIAVPKASGGANGSAQGSDHTKINHDGFRKRTIHPRSLSNYSGEKSRGRFFAHDRVIIVGEELARDGVSPILDFFFKTSTCTSA